MKIIHTGDIHIGSPLKNLSADKAQRRKTEILKGFFKLCAYAKETGVRAVIIAGDLFDESGVSKSVQAQVFSAMEKAKPVCFFYALGNHDECVHLDGAPDNLYAFSNNGEWKTYDLGENVFITGLHSKYFSAQAFDALSLSNQAFHFLVLHGDIRDRASSEFIPLTALLTKPVDYLALGHIHEPTLRAERLGMRGAYRYCGCLEGRGFDEIGSRGFFLLEIENGRLTGEKFLSFATRTVWETRVDISACRSYFDVENAVFSSVKDLPSKDMVKIVLCGNYVATLRKDVPLLTDRLNEKFFFARVEDTSRLAFSYQDYEKDFTERGEFVREVLRANVPSEQKESILEVGLKALFGEEIDL